MLTKKLHVKHKILQNFIITETEKFSLVLVVMTLTSSRKLDPIKTKTEKRFNIVMTTTSWDTSIS